MTGGTRISPHPPTPSDSFIRDMHKPWYCARPVTPSMQRLANNFDCGGAELIREIEGLSKSYGSAFFSVDSMVARCYPGSMATRKLINPADCDHAGLRTDADAFIAATTRRARQEGETPWNDMLIGVCKRCGSNLNLSAVTAAGLTCEQLAHWPKP